jgi:hypothetical protein
MLLRNVGSHAECTTRYFKRWQHSSVFLHSVCRLLVRANVVPSSPILVTLMKEALRFSETSVLRRAIQRNMSEEAILHSHRRVNVKSYNIPLNLFIDNSEVSLWFVVE